MIHATSLVIIGPEFGKVVETHEPYFVFPWV